MCGPLLEWFFLLVFWPPCINLSFDYACRRVVNAVVYQQPFLPSGARLCINCAAPVPGAESLPEGATLQGMQLLFCRWGRGRVDWGAFG